MPTEKSCGIVLLRGNEPLYLILKYRAGHWSFPKGHVEGSETEHETAKRELFEETGIQAIELIDGFRRAIAYDFGPPSRRITKTVVFFLARTLAETVTLSHEHRGYAWLIGLDARHRLTFDKDRDVLDHAIAFQNAR